MYTFYLTRANCSHAFISVRFIFIFMALKISISTLDCMQAQNVLHFSASFIQIKVEFSRHL